MHHAEKEVNNELRRLMPHAPDASRFTIVCSKDDYSARRIAHAIEDCGAHVLNLNVTADDAGENHVAVDVRVDRNDLSSIVRSLARYDYNVIGEHSTQLFTDDDRRRVDELLRYLDV